MKVLMAVSGLSGLARAASRGTLLNECPRASDDAMKASGTLPPTGRSPSSRNASLSTSSYSKSDGKTYRGGALAAARRLVAPAAVSSTHGEWEGVDFWEENEELLEAARLELGPRSARAYAPTYAECFEPAVVAALEAREPAQALAALATEMVPGVFAIELMREDFLRDLAAELEHLRESGVPLRRPNGMNRHGCVLSHLGFQAGFLDNTIGAVLKPLGLALFPRALRAEDVAELYGFSILYDAENNGLYGGGDRDLAEHADGAALTINLCLGHDFDGGDLLFRGVRFHQADADVVPRRRVAHRPGVALVHLGQHLHAAAPLSRGRRENVVVWATGQYGYVRIAPYDDDDDAPPPRPPPGDVSAPGTASSQNIRL